MPTVSKIEAADRQYNAGVQLYFSGADPLISHALISAALNVYTDLSARKGVESWIQKAAIDNGIDLAHARSIFNRSWNFLKHADRDPDAVLEFDNTETEHLAMFATLEKPPHGELTRHMEVFQYWYLAKHPIESQSELIEASALAFPDLLRLTHPQQLAAGKTFLASYIET